MTLFPRTPARRIWRNYANPQSWLISGIIPGFNSARPSRISGSHGWDPKITVKKADGKLRYRIEAEGARPEDLEVSVGEGVIIVKGERQHRREVERRGHGWQEISQSSFCRSLSLPRSADWEKAEASFEDGVLEVSMALTEDEPKYIKIQRV